MTDSSGRHRYARLAEVPEPYSSIFRNVLAHEGVENVGLLGYIRDNGRLPGSIGPPSSHSSVLRGQGAEQYALFELRTRQGLGCRCARQCDPQRDWGPDDRVIPHRLGVPSQGDNLARWRRWMRHIDRDQGICDPGLDRGDGLAVHDVARIHPQCDGHRRPGCGDGRGRYCEPIPRFGSIFWIMTLSCGFLVLVPGQVSVCDQIARRWTDMIWTASARAHRLGARRSSLHLLWNSGHYGEWDFWSSGSCRRSRLPRSGPSSANWPWGSRPCRPPYLNSCDAPELRAQGRPSNRHRVLRHFFSGDQYGGTLERLGRDYREVTDDSSSVLSNRDGHPVLGKGVSDTMSKA